jgi:hypothetical protein
MIIPVTKELSVKPMMMRSEDYDETSVNLASIKNLESLEEKEEEKERLEGFLGA